MQLDKTRLAIRERSPLEIMDLAIHLVREFAGPLTITLAIGAAPMAAMNFLLVGWLADPLYGSEELSGFPVGYVWYMALLVFFEAPLAAAWTTAFLGQIVFVEHPSLRAIVGDVLRMTPRLIWCHVVVRGVGVAWLMMLGIGDGDDSVGLGVLLFLVSCGVALLRALRPFINEIVLLERTPLRAGRQKRMTVGRRSSLLHGPIGGDLFVQWIASAFFAASLFGALTYTVHTASGALFNNWKWNPIVTHVGIPLVLWCVAGFFSVVRFLNYLDSRIRQEGWEVELRLRAEAARMASRLT